MGAIDVGSCDSQCILGSRLSRVFTEQRRHYSTLLGPEKLVREPPRVSSRTSGRVFGEAFDLWRNRGGGNVSHRQGATAELALPSCYRLAPTELALPSCYRQRAFHMYPKTQANITRLDLTHTRVPLLLGLNSFQMYVLNA